MRLAIEKINKALSTNNDPRSLRVKIEQSRSRQEALKQAIKNEEYFVRAIEDLLYIREVQNAHPDRDDDLSMMVDLVLIFFKAEEVHPDEGKEIKVELVEIAEKMRALLDLPDAPYGKKK